MRKAHGPWTILASHSRYANEFLAVQEDQVIGPDGAPTHYGVVVMRPGIAILPVDADGVVYLTRQFRYALGRESLEAIGGGLDEGEEDPLPAARREAREELGVTADEWHYLGQTDTDTSVLRGTVHLYVARELSFTEPDREGSETIRPVRMPLTEAVERVMDGAITHAPSCVVLLKAARLMQAERGGRSSRAGLPARVKGSTIAT